MTHCSKCEDDLPLEMFYLKKDGSAHPWCKPCRKEARRAYYLKNREKAIATSRKWNVENRDRYNANQRTYNERHSEVHVERVAQWRRENPENARRLRRTNDATRRARKASVYVENVDPVVVFVRDNGVCGICLKEVDVMDFHVDHIVPLALGGYHSYENVQTAHSKCNLAKGAKLLVTNPNNLSEGG